MASPYLDAAEGLIQEGLATMEARFPGTMRVGTDVLRRSAAIPRGRLMAIFRHGHDSEVIFIPEVPYRDVRNAIPAFMHENPYEVAEEYRKLYRLLVTKKPRYQTDPVLPNPTASHLDWANVFLALTGQPMRLKGTGKIAYDDVVMDGFTVSLFREIEKKTGLDPTKIQYYKGKTMRGYIEWLRNILTQNFSVIADEALVELLNKRVKRRLASSETMLQLLPLLHAVAGTDVTMTFLSDAGYVVSGISDQFIRESLDKKDYESAASRLATAAFSSRIGYEITARRLAASRDRGLLFDALRSLVENNIDLRLILRG